MSLSEQRSTGQAVANEREALRLIGIAGAKQRLEFLLPPDQVALAA